VWGLAVNGGLCRLRRSPECSISCFERSTHSPGYTNCETEPSRCARRRLTTSDSKLDSKSSLHLLNELADLHSCNNTLYFEARRHEDLYLWASRSPNGPSVKCHVNTIVTMDELKMTGNCLKGSRGLVCFDGGWEKDEHWRLLKEMFTHVSRGVTGVGSE
jgi:hypothetical protein